MPGFLLVAVSVTCQRMWLNGLGIGQPTTGILGDCSLEVECVSKMLLDYFVCVRVAKEPRNTCVWQSER